MPERSKSITELREYKRAYFVAKGGVPELRAKGVFSRTHHASKLSDVPPEPSV